MRLQLLLITLVAASSQAQLRGLRPSKPKGSDKLMASSPPKGSDKPMELDVAKTSLQSILDVFDFSLIDNINDTTIATTTNNNKANREKIHRNKNKPKGSDKNKELSCKQIRNQEDRRKELCKLDNVRQSCPQSCGLCCEDDSEYKFMNENQRLKKCTYITDNSQRINANCQAANSQNGRTIRDACPRSCDVCKDFVEPSKPMASSPPKGSALPKASSPPKV